MKKIMQFATLFWVCLFSANLIQSQSNLKSKEPVKVVNWKNKAMLIIDEIWEQAKNEIVLQVGEEKYKEIRRNYDWKSIPSQMTIFDGNRRRTVIELSKKLDSLKCLYKIATFSAQAKGGIPINIAIVEVPYKGNEDWDPKAKWNVVYFLLNVDDIQVIK
ncbi:hypothetical protein FAM09_11445 [Niastella caeni]|uniref:Uncharacterized protein n=1 Tax=Niastella caeni TaxID=2569763 RepID=A0A4S8HXI6_9BACT|nr:hypothetical protein [Niastella caeni]THU40468.1 hypothetical protein FAM09_11445 [Niastella caeni]